MGGVASELTRRGSSSKSRRRRRREAKFENRLYALDGWIYSTLPSARTPNILYLSISTSTEDLSSSNTVQ